MTDQKKNAAAKPKLEGTPLSSSLQGYGFKPARHQKKGHWQFYDRGKVDSPWRNINWSVVERRGKVFTDGLNLEFDLSGFSSRLKKAAKSHYGSRTQTELKSDSDLEHWCLFEFVSPGSRERLRTWKGTEDDPIPPVGVGGFRLTLFVDGFDVCYGLSDHFAVGFVPDTFAAATVAMVEEALGFKRPQQLLGNSEFRSLFEGRMDVFHLALGLGFKGRVRKKGVDPKLAALVQAIAEEGRQHLNLVKNQDRLQVKLQDPLIHNEEPSTPLLSKIPIVVLESREEGPVVRKLDQEICQRKYDRLAEMIRQYGEHKIPLHLMRRFCLISVTDKRLDIAPQLQEWLDKFDRDKLFLSYAIQKSLRLLDKNTTLDALSRLTMRLMEEISGIDEVGTFDVVLPELLGDAWQDQDHDRAIECYKRVLQSRGDVPRVLRKIVQVAATKGDKEQEFEHLGQLVQCERRKKDLSRLYLRMAELAEMLQRQRPDVVPLDFASKAYSYDSSHPEIVAIFTRFLLAAELPDKAIHVLDDFLKSHRTHLAQKWVVEFETEVARIWEQVLNRPDLALRRYQEAFRKDPSHQEALRFLENHYRKEEDPLSLAYVLAAKLKHLELAESRRHAYLDELVQMAAPGQGGHKEVENLLREGLLATAQRHQLREKDVDRILSLEYSADDWRTIYEGIKDQFSAGDDLVKRGRAYLILAHVARTRMGNLKAALGHLLDALKIGQIDQANFEFLVNTLKAFGDTKLLTRVYDLRLDQVPEAEKILLMEKLLQVPDLLSDSRKEELSLNLLTLKGDPSEVKSRLQYYSDLEDVDGLARLKQGLFEQLEDRQEKVKWLGLIQKLITPKTNPDFFPLVEQNFRDLIAWNHDIEATLQGAIDYFHVRKAKEILKGFLRLALDHDVVPALPQKVLESHFGRSSSEFLQLIMLQAKKAHAKTEKIRLLDEALLLVAKIDPFDPRRFELLYQVGQLRALKNTELQQAKGLASTNDRDFELAQLLESQLQLVKDSDLKGQFILTAASIALDKLDDLPRAERLLLKGLEYNSSRLESSLRMADLAQAKGEPAAERRYLGRYLDFADPLAQKNEMQHVIERLSVYADDREMRARVVPVLNEWVRAGLIDDVIQLCSALIETRTIVAAVAGYLLDIIIAQPEDKVVHHLERIFLSIDKTSVESLCEVAFELFQSNNKVGILDQVCLDLMAAGKLADEVLIPLSRLMGMRLYQTGERKEIAEQLLASVYEAQPEDNSNLVLPLYFLKAELQSENEVKEFVRQILPTLQQHPDLLEETPITLEALEKFAETGRKGNFAIAELSEFNFVEGSAITGLKEVTGESKTAAPPPPPPPEGGDFAGQTLDLGFDAVEPSEIKEPDPEGTAPLQEVPLDLAAIEVSDGSQELLDKEGAQQSPEDSASKSTQPDRGKSETSPAEEDDDGGHLTDYKPPVAGPAKLAPLRIVPREPSGVVKLSEDIFAGEPSVMTTQKSTSAPEAFIGPMPQLGPVYQPDFSRMDPVVSPPVPPPVDNTQVEGEGAQEENVEESFAENSPTIKAEAGEFAKTPGDTQTFTVPPPPPVPTSPAPKGDDSPKVQSIQKVPEPPAPPSLPAAPQPDGVADYDESTRLVSETDLNAASSNSLSLANEESATGLGHGTGTGESSIRSSTGSLEPIKPIEDWRAVVRQRNLEADPRGIYHLAFASETEKHMALQTISLLSGNMRELETWHWRVWRDATQYAYNLSGKERFPGGAVPNVIDGSLFRLLNFLQPILVKLFQDRFSINYLAQKFRRSPGEIMGAAQTASWGEGLLGKVGMGLIAGRLTRRGYKALILTGLGQEIFYDAVNKAIFFDASYYSSRPPGHLFHRVSFVIWALELRFYFLLMLDGGRHLLPIIAEIDLKMKSQGIDKLKDALRGKSLVRRMIDEVNPHQLRSFYSKVGVPSATDLQMVKRRMEEKIFQLILSETLDLVGLVEAITNDDLMKAKYKPGAILSANPHIAGLLDFATKLRL